MTNAILLVTSNGAGLGHLSRMTATAHELARLGAEPVLASMSAALPLVTRSTGLRGEYIPGPRRGWVDPRRWQGYFAQRLTALARELSAVALVYDGVAPYAGLLAARAALPDIPFVWSRRGFWRPGTNRRALWCTPAFDLVIEPGDVCGDADAGATRARREALRVGPVSLFHSTPQLPRAQARRRLGLDPGRPAALVTLGASGGGEAALRALLEAPDWQVAVTRPPLGGTASTAGAADRLVELSRVFPLVPLLSAFDAAVTAAGYNTVHECLPARLPSLLVPASTGTDDQARRARAAAARGWALASAGDAVGPATRRLVDAGTRARLAESCRSVPPVDGSRAAAEAILGATAGHPGHRPGWRERLARAELQARSTARAAATRGQPGRPAPLASADATYQELLGDRPIEHLLRDASVEYETRRLELAEQVYGVPPESAGGR